MSLTTVSICRESSARALVCEIVRDWLKDAIFAVPTPIRASSGILSITSLIDGGMLLFTLRLLWPAGTPLVEVFPVWALTDGEGALPVEGAAFFVEAQAMSTTRRQRHTKSVFFILLLHI
jgi:hypothetical protein